MTDDHLFSHVKEVLGAFDLKSTPATIVADLALPARSAAFLREVGLPTREVLPGLVFDLVEHLPLPSEAFPPEKFAFPESWQTTRVLGIRYDIGVFIDLSDGGSVWEVDPSCAADARFMNSSVESLGYFLAELIGPVCGGPRPKSEDAKAWWAGFGGELRKIDAAAFDDEGANYWPLVIEDQLLMS